MGEPALGGRCIPHPLIGALNATVLSCCCRTRNLVAVKMTTSREMGSRRVMTVSHWTEMY